MINSLKFNPKSHRKWVLGDNKKKTQLNLRQTINKIQKKKEILKNANVNKQM